MAGIDEYMERCLEEDERSYMLVQAAERELERQTRQIQYEAEVRGRIMALRRIAPLANDPQQAAWDNFGPGEY